MLILDDFDLQNRVSKTSPTLLRWKFTKKRMKLPNLKQSLCLPSFATLLRFYFFPEQIANCRSGSSLDLTTSYREFHFDH